MGSALMDERQVLLLEERPVLRRRIELVVADDVLARVSVCVELDVTERGREGAAGGVTYERIFSRSSLPVALRAWRSLR